MVHAEYHECGNYFSLAKYHMYTLSTLIERGHNQIIKDSTAFLRSSDPQRRDILGRRKYPVLDRDIVETRLQLVVSGEVALLWKRTRDVEVSFGASSLSDLRW